MLFFHAGSDFSDVSGLSTLAHYSSPSIIYELNFRWEKEHMAKCTKLETKSPEKPSH